MNRMGVYQIELNGKRYVGSTSRNFKGRWNSHLRDLQKGVHHSIYLQRVFNKYGKEALKFSILEIVETPEEVIVIEQRYIDELKPEYNICRVAGSLLGRKCTKETRRKLSKASTGRKPTIETRQKMSEAKVGNKQRLGYKHTKETKRKIGEAQIGKNISEETRQRLIKMSKENSQIKKGKHLSEETKRKLSEAGIRRKYTEETRKKMSRAQAGHKVSEETKRKISEARKNWWIKKKGI